MAQKGNVLRLIEVNQKLATGIAMGVIAGYAKLVDEVADKKGDLAKRGFDNPILNGALLGWIEFLDKAGESLSTALTAAAEIKRP